MSNHINPDFLPSETKTDYFDASDDTTAEVTRMPVAQSKRKASMVAIMENANLAASYTKARDEMETTGESQSAKRIIDASSENEIQSDTDTANLIVLDQNLSLDEKYNSLLGLQRQISERTGATLESSFTDHMATIATTHDAVEESVHTGFFNNVDEIKQANNEIEDIKTAFGAKLDSSTPKALADLTISAIFPGFGIKIKQIVSSVLPEAGPTFNNLAVGEELVELRRVWRGATGKGRVAMAKGVTELAEEVASFLYNNDYEKYDIVNTILGELNPTDADIQNERWLNDAFGFIDLIPVLGTTASKGIRLWKRISKASTPARAATVAPNNAQDMLAAAIIDPEVADAMGVSAKEILSTSIMPDPITEVKIVTPDLKEILASRKFTDPGERTHGINYTPNEKIVSAERTQANIDKIARAEGTVLLSSSDVTKITGGYNVNFAVGHSSGYGFPSRVAARESVEDFLEVESGAKVTILERDYANGTWKKSTAPEDAPGEYIATINVDHIYRPADVLGDSLTDVVIGQSGPWAKYLDKSSVYLKWIVDAGNVASDQFSRVTKELEQIMQPLSQLGPGRQSKVYQTLDEGSVDRKWFSNEELIDKFEGDEPMIAGYNATRAHQDTVYNLHNEKFRGDMDSSGFRKVSIEDGEYQQVAKPVRKQDLTEEVKRVYDPETGSIIDIDNTQLEALYQEGGTLARLPGEEFLGNELYDTLIIKGAGRAKLTELPTNLLKYLDGYITNKYKTTHIVKELVTGVTKNGSLIKPARGATFNGRPLRPGERLRTVAMADNQGAALRAARALKRGEGIGAEYGVVEAKELQDAAYANQNSWEFFRDKGQLFFSKRGEEIKSISGKRSLDGIAESIEAARISVAKYVSVDDFTDSMTRRWELKYGERFGGELGNMPLTGELRQVPNKGIQDIADEADAIAIRDHIALVAGIDDTAYKRNWKRLVVSIGNKISGTGETLEGELLRERVGATVLSARETGPVELLKQGAFLKFIVWAPSRQLLLQSQQASIYLGVEYGAKYFGSGKGVRDWTGLTMGLAIRSNDKLWKEMSPAMAKGMGMSGTEFTNFVDAFKRTGLGAAIDSHPFASALALGKRPNASGDVLFGTGKAAKEAFKTVTRWSRIMGFDAGEYVNISSAFLASRNKFIIENPGKNWLDKDNLDLIGGDARELGFNMNPSGGLAFQKGTMGGITQFMSHAAKSAQVLIPTKALGKTIGKFGNKRFAGWNRFRISTMQLALYGVGGYGLQESYELFRDSTGVEMPQEVDTVVREGIAGSLVTAAFHTSDIGDEDTDLSFSSNFGPFSGSVRSTPVSMVLNGLGNMIMAKPFDIARVLPAGLALPMEMAELIKQTNFLVGDVDDPDISTSDKFIIIAKDTAALAPVFGNYFRAHSALQIGKFSTRYGNRTVDATTGEIMAKMYFGIRSRKDVAVGEMLREFRGQTLVSKPGLQREIDNIGNKLYSYTLSVARKLGTNEVTPQRMLSISLKSRQALKFALPPVQYARAMQAFKRRAFRDLNKDGQTKLIELLASYYSKGIIPIESRTSTRIRNMPDFKAKQELLKWVDYSLESPAEQSEVR